MTISRLIFMLFIVVPLIEIALFVQVGGAIGYWTAVALVIITAALGVSLLRWQGFSTLKRARESMENNRFPAEELVEGLVLLFCAGLLLTPGFLTDAVGFLLLVPAIRKACAVMIIRYGKKHASFVSVDGAMSGGFSRSSEDGNVFEGEFRREDELAEKHIGDK